MHELHIVQSVVKSVLEKVEGDPSIIRIAAIKLKLGVLTMVSAESFKATFGQLAKESLCKDAELLIEEAPGSNVVVEHIEAEYR